MRVQLLEKNIRLLERIAKLKVLGAQDRKDVLLQYAISSGYIPADPLETILHPERSEAQETEKARVARYNRGLMNPRARRRDNDNITRTNQDGQTEAYSERVYNASRIADRNPGLEAGIPSVAGTQYGGFYSSYQNLLNTLRGGSAVGAGN